MNRSAVDSTHFRSVCGRFATGIAVVTVLSPDGKPHGLTVNSFTSVSLDPPMVLVCIDHRSKLLPHFRTSEWYGVNVLRDDQRDVSQHFAQRTADKFESIDWLRGSSGVPLLREALAWFECRAHQIVDAGDHAVLIARVEHAQCHEGNPLLYFSSRYRTLG